MGDWTHGHACQILKKQLDYSQGWGPSRFEFRNAVDKVCDERKPKEELMDAINTYQNYINDFVNVSNKDLENMLRMK